MTTVIKFEDVSKKYKLYSKGGLYLRDRITHALGRLNPFNGVSSSTRHLTADTQSPSPATQHPLERDFWALKKVSFEIKEGESVGFIGRNGAGKSTILKLLAGVTKPTSGKVEVNGRVAALIEVGAGFHPELTGRENIYLNGSILGMRKADIEKCFDNIVSFAELEEFIDTPVKHYSSGMYVRLGFAIAAHTNPAIYLIDEVLAVGDASFQKKCLSTLSMHRASGKTMILVSHDLARIREVCDRCIYVNRGEIRFDGIPSQGIKMYGEDLFGQEERRGTTLIAARACLASVTVQDGKGNARQSFQQGEDVIVRIRYNAKQRIEFPAFGIALYASDGDVLTCFNTKTSGLRLESLEGQGSVFCRLRSPALRGGNYRITAWFHDHDDRETYDCLAYCCGFQMLPAEDDVDGWVHIRRDWFGDVRFHRIRPSTAVEQEMVD